MDQIIKINKVNFNDESVDSVDARELHEKLKVGKHFATWIKQRIEEAQLIEGHDFIIFPKNGKNSKAQKGRPLEEYALSIEAAEHIAMLEHSKEGKKIRQYFISFEREAKKKLIEMANVIIKQDKREAARVTVNQLTALRESSVVEFDKLKQALTLSEDYKTYPNISNCFASLQDLMHVMTTGMSASEIKISRANAERIHCGAFSGYKYGNNKKLNPRSLEVARNFLSFNELEIERHFANMFLSRLNVAMLKEERVYTVKEFLAFIYDLAEHIADIKDKGRIVSAKFANEIVHKRAEEYNNNEKLLNDGYDQFMIAKNNIPLFAGLEENQKLLIVRHE